MGFDSATVERGWAGESAGRARSSRQPNPHEHRVRLLSLTSAGVVAASPLLPALRSTPETVLLATKLAILFLAFSVIGFHFRDRTKLPLTQLFLVAGVASFIIRLVLEGISAVPLVDAAILCLLVAMSLLSSRRFASGSVPDWLASVALLSAGAALLGFLFRVDEIEGIQRFIAVSPVAAAELVLLCLAVLFADSRGGAARAVTRDDVSGDLLRRSLPLTLAATLALGFAVMVARDAEVFSRQFALPLFVELEMILLTVVIWRSAARLRKIDDRRDRAERELRDHRNQLEERVRQRTAELQRLNEELESFSYSISHDLRAPLRAIHGFSQILQDDHGDQLDPEAVRAVEIVQNNAEAMGQLISDLLAFSRISRREVVTQRVDMKQLAAEAYDNAAAGHDPGPRLEIGPLPDAEADPAMARQVLENLLSNAVKYSGDKPDGLISISGNEENGFNRYQIRDNGVGFDPAHAGKLFGVFQRLHSSEQFEGTGVGLSIVKRIVEKHGGEVGADSTPGEGATFWFTLPAAPGNGGSRNGSEEEVCRDG